MYRVGSSQGPLGRRAGRLANWSVLSVKKKEPRKKKKKKEKKKKEKEERWKSSVTAYRRPTLAL